MSDPRPADRQLRASGEDEDEVVQAGAGPRDCIEKIQFWSHGSSDAGMCVARTGGELTVDDFTVPDLAQFGRMPTFMEIVRGDAYAKA